LTFWLLMVGFVILCDTPMRAGRQAAYDCLRQLRQRPTVFERGNIIVVG
jgi:hypothetical protein